MIPERNRNAAYTRLWEVHDVLRSRFYWRYLMAVVWLVLCYLLERSFNPVLHGRLAFTFFVTSALLAAWSGGWDAGLFALVGGFLMADYFFVPPVGSIGKYGQIEWVLLIGNAVPAFIGILLFEGVYRARVRLANKTRRLEEEAVRRAEAEMQLRAAQKQLAEYALDLEAAVQERTADLKTSVAFLESFCYTIAHDLRAPLRAMNGFVNVLTEELPRELPSDAATAARRISEAARRMDKLILDLLEYGRISHVPLKFQNVRLDQLVNGVVSDLREIVQRTRATIEIDSSLGTVWSDPDLLRLSVRHLVQNALQFTRPEEPPRVHIRSEAQGGDIRLLVSDNGIGIPEQYRQKIFGPFQTLAAPRPDRTGIGLAIVSKAAERLNARAGMESTLGKGSTFWFDLPTRPKRRDIRNRPRPFSPDEILVN
jgi:signal transduction histidine kinase